MPLPASHISAWKCWQLLLRAIMFPFPSSRFLVLGVRCSQIAPVPISLALGSFLASPLWLETLVLLFGCLWPWAQTEPPSLVRPQSHSSLWMLLLLASCLLLVHAALLGARLGVALFICAVLYPLRAVSLSLHLWRASLPLCEAGRQTLTQRGKVTNPRSHS